jgi:hypothetical protein
MGVLELPTPSHAWSFVRGIAVGLVLAAGGAGAFLAFSPVHVVFQGSGSAAATGVKGAAPATKDALDIALDDDAKRFGVTLDARMRRASRIYIAALCSTRAGGHSADLFYPMVLKHYASDPDHAPFNDMLADSLKSISELGALDGAPPVMPGSWTEACHRLHDMDFE